MVQAFVEQCCVRERCSCRLGAATPHVESGIINLRHGHLFPLYFISESKSPGHETEGNQMDEGVLKTSSHANFKPSAHDNLLWHWTLFEVGDSAVDEKPVPFWPTTASHFTLSWCHSSVKGTCSCHDLMRTPKREQILLHCTIWVTRKTTPSCLEGHRSVCPARTKAPTPSNSMLSRTSAQRARHFVDTPTTRLPIRSTLVAICALSSSIGP